MALLEVSSLHVGYSVGDSWLKAVDGIDLSLESGESIGIIGESGCGKSSLLSAVCGLLPPNAKIFSGSCMINGNNIYRMPKTQLNAVRWVDMAVVFQGAMNALNPVIKVGNILTEAYQRHFPSENKIKVRKRLYEVLDIVSLPKRVAAAYPHELSGGMRQRAVIALALICNPKLLLADEPTTALDVVVQDEILACIRELQQQLGFGLVFVSHDVSVVAETCERVAVMYGGKIVETGNTEKIFKTPSHPYTIGLMHSFLSLDGELETATSIPGYPPKLIDPLPGCRFAERCPLCDHNLCVKVDPERHVKDGHEVLCHYAYKFLPEAVVFKAKGDESLG